MFPSLVTAEQSKQLCDEMFKRVYNSADDVDKLRHILGACTSHRDMKNSKGLCLLTEAVRLNDIVRIKNFLELGMIGPTKSNPDVTPLQIACQIGNLETVKLLLTVARPFDIKHINNKGESPLSLAVTGGNYDVVEYLLANTSVDVNQTIRFYFHRTSCLHRAIQVLRDDKMVKMLLQAGAHTNTSNEVGATPLMCAVQSGRPKIVTALIEAGADVNQRAGIDADLRARFSPLAISCWKDVRPNVEPIIRALLRARVNLRLREESAYSLAVCAQPLCLSALRQPPLILQLFVSVNAPLECIQPKHDHCSPLDIALGSARFDNALVLLHAGAKWRDNGLTAFALDNKDNVFSSQLYQFAHNAPQLRTLTVWSIRKQLGDYIYDKVHMLRRHLGLPSRLADLVLMRDVITESDFVIPD